MGEVVLLVVRIFPAVGEAGGKEDVLLLAGITVGNPEPSEVDHFRRVEAQFFLELAAGQLFRVVDFGFPAALRQLDGPLLDGVAELLDQPDLAVVDGQDNGRGVFLNHAVDALLAVGAEDLVLAEAHPAVAIDLAGGQCGNGTALAAFGGVHGLRITGCEAQFWGRRTSGRKQRRGSESLNDHRGTIFY